MDRLNGSLPGITVGSVILAAVALFTLVSLVPTRADVERVDKRLTEHCVKPGHIDAVAQTRENKARGVANSRAIEQLHTDVREIRNGIQILLNRTKP